MKPVIIIAIAFVLLIPVNVFGISEISDISIDEEIMDLEFNQNTKLLYVATRDSQVLVLDPDVPVIIDIIKLLDDPNSLDVNQSTNKIYVTSSLLDSLFIIDGKTNEVTETIQFDSHTEDVVVNSVTNKIYVSHSRSDSISVIDGKTNTIVDSIPIESPHDLEINEKTNTLYATFDIYGDLLFGKNKNNSISVINGDFNEIIATVEVGDLPVDIAINEKTNHVYVANLNSDTISIIDGNTNTLSHTIKVKIEPVSVAVNEKNNRVYAGMDFSGELLEIDGQTNSILSTYEILGPLKIVVNEDLDEIYSINEVFGYNSIDILNTGIEKIPENTYQKLPEWVRNIFIWYAEEQISEDELLGAIQFLADMGIIEVN